MKKAMKIMSFAMAFAICFACIPLVGMSQDNGMHDQKMNKKMMKDQSIYQIASQNDSLSTFVELVKKAGLKKVLNKKDGPYTVFAPTNDAFDALPQKMMKKLMKRTHRKKLRKILRNHIVSGSVMSSDLSDGQSVSTMGGGHAMVSMNNNQTMINNAKVVKADIEASNGVIHIVNKVMMPSSDHMMKKGKMMKDDDGHMKNDDGNMNSSN